MSRLRSGQMSPRSWAATPPRRANKSRSRCSPRPVASWIPAASIQRLDLRSGDLLIAVHTHPHDVEMTSFLDVRSLRGQDSAPLPPWVPAVTAIVATVAGLLAAATAALLDVGPVRVGVAVALFLGRRDDPVHRRDASPAPPVGHGLAGLRRRRGVRRDRQHRPWRQPPDDRRHWLRSCRGRRLRPSRGAGHGRRRAHGVAVLGRDGCRHRRDRPAARVQRHRCVGRPPPSRRGCRPCPADVCRRRARPRPDRLPAAGHHRVVRARTPPARASGHRSARRRR